MIGELIRTKITEVSEPKVVLVPNGMYNIWVEEMLSGLFKGGIGDFSKVDGVQVIGSNLVNEVTVLHVGVNI